MHPRKSGEGAKRQGRILGNWGSKRGKERDRKGQTPYISEHGNTPTHCD